MMKEISGAWELGDSKGHRWAKLAVWNWRAGSLSAGTKAGTQQLNRNRGKNEGGNREL